MNDRRLTDWVMAWFSPVSLEHRVAIRWFLTATNGRNAPPHSTAAAKQVLRRAGLW